MVGARSTPAGCPWGEVDDETQIGPDIWVVSTPSHGGLYVGPDSASHIPPEVQDCMGTRPWYEEDCEMVIILALLWDRLDMSAVAATWSSLDQERVVELAERTASDFDSYNSCLEAIRATRR